MSAATNAEEAIALVRTTFDVFANDRCVSTAELDETDEEAESICALLTEGAQAEARIQAALALHQPDFSGECTQCYDGSDSTCEPYQLTWPCPTVRALTQ